MSRPLAASERRTAAVAPAYPREGTARASCISREARRRGRVLLHQQCWLWGQDIRRPEGNALLEYGFERRRPPEGEQGSNAYILRPTPDRCAVLWGFGFYWRDARVPCGCGGIFLPRFTFTPKLARAAGPPLATWLPGQLSDCRPPGTPRQWDRARRLLIPALRWVASYERWILERRGLVYRRECTAAGPKGSTKFLPAEELAAAWDRLADCCEDG